MGIEKTKLLAHKSVYWSSINADIKRYIKQCATCIGFQQTCSQRKRSFTTTYPSGHRTVVRADIFHFNNKNYLCVVDYNSKFPVIKRLEGLSMHRI